LSIAVFSQPMSANSKPWLDLIVEDLDLGFAMVVEFAAHVKNPSLISCGRISFPVLRNISYHKRGQIP